ncbi:hypothetical protein Ahy_B01g053168 [Arachis hypogaea]|uniref:Uncharacterized protein n=1 Tax=Arachis hypogaea TaxID=3818 RepID=A0A445ARA0_ARAHY|nr:hypothetical protein Ahy_B01g053168 [Arachis hypogaea]
MTPSKGSSSSSNHHGWRLGGGHSCSGIRDGQYPKCLCGLYTIISTSRTHKNLGRLFFGCLLYKNDVSVKNVAMGGGEIVANISPMYYTNDAGLERKLMELQNRIDLLEI